MPAPVAVRSSDTLPEGPDDFDRWEESEPVFMSVSDWLADEAGPGAPTDEDGGSDRLVGTLLHRLFQNGYQASGDQDPGALRWLLGPDERAAVDDPARTIAHAVEAWRAMKPEVDALTATGQPSFELPFSLRLEDEGRPGTVLRGTIDCLLVRDDGSVVVIELKSGRRRGWHQRQLDIYVRAARALFPGATVNGVLVYPGARQPLSNS